MKFLASNYVAVCEDTDLFFTPLTHKVIKYFSIENVKKKGLLEEKKRKNVCKYINMKKKVSRYRKSITTCVPHFMAIVCSC
jgi:hypothetical protein